MYGHALDASSRLVADCLRPGGRHSTLLPSLGRLEHVRQDDPKRSRRRQLYAGWVSVCPEPDHSESLDLVRPLLTMRISSADVGLFTTYSTTLILNSTLLHNL
jgi:hypothetical protein